MFNDVIFYNSFGNGDIFESREFVKELMERIPADNYYYSHLKNPRILLDIPKLKFMEMSPLMNPSAQVLRNSTTLLINTWIGITGRYLLPGIGCTVEGLCIMYNDILSSLGLGKLSREPIDYIPSIDYSVYDTVLPERFAAFHKEEIIFIDNGMVMSKQAENFHFHEIIYRIASNHKDKCFVVTNSLPIHCSNVIPTSYINGKKDFDLPEISYLSTFCSTLIGRNSGPHVFTQVKRNVMDENKKLLSFTYKPTGSSFVVNTDVKIKKHWSDATSVKEVIDVIERVLDE